MAVTPARGALIFHTWGTTVEEMLLCNSRMPNHGIITVMVIVVKVPAEWVSFSLESELVFDLLTVTDDHFIWVYYLLSTIQSLMLCSFSEHAGYSLEVWIVIISLWWVSTCAARSLILFVIRLTYWWSLWAFVLYVCVCTCTHLFWVSSPVNY